MFDTDIDRMRDAYRQRTERRDLPDRYSHFNPAHLFMLQQRQRVVLAALRAAGYPMLRGRRILEVGCGSGGVLLELLTFGASARLLNGVDVIERRAANALSHVRASVLTADGQALPYASATFDLLLQFTAFSSVLDEVTRFQMAQEMVRVLKPGGAILWYDFIYNPGNRDTRGIGKAELRRLFPNCAITFRRVTLAPPLTRRLVGFSWGLCAALEKLRLLNSHWLAVIRP